MEAAAKGAVYLIDWESIEVLGVGTGRTVAAFLRIVANDAGRKPLIVPSSLQTAMLARRYGFEVVDPRVGYEVDIYVDGADEVELASGSMIKGGGGALLGEKILAWGSGRNVFIVGSDKVVDRLGIRTPVPLEVVNGFAGMVLDYLERMGFKASVREGSGKRGPVVSDWGGVIIDVHIGVMESPEKIDSALKSIPGVVETGIFVGYADVVIVGYGGMCEWRKFEFERAVGVGRRR